jgi:predicted helicase
VFQPVNKNQGLKPVSSPVKLYIASLQSAFARGDATEHTHRPALKTLLESNVKGIQATNEPKSSERENKPDYIVRKGASIIGFVEAKDIGKDLKATLKTPQLKRYLEALPNLIVTNYLDFAWFVAGEKRISISLGEVNGKHIQMAEDADARWAELISSFCNEVTPTVSSPSQLAKTLAGETRLLKDLVAELVIAKDSELLSQQEAFQTLLVPDLKPEEFADMYAQTAAYGLFTARVFEHTTLFGAPTQNVPDSLKNDAFSLEKAAYLIPKANPFLRQFFQHIASPNLNNQLRWLIEQIADSLRYADIEKVLHRQSRKQGFEDPIFHFYETFLAEYDRALRESRGVYYTPEPVVDFIVRGVDWLLKEKFGKPDGLADKDTLILDPATGTATFLRKVIDQIHAQVTASGNVGMWPQYVRERLLPRIFGFELMMAPYTVAHLKLALQLQEQGFEFQDGERLHVYLTNTLDQLHKATQAMLGTWIAKENEGAENVKLNEPVQVILGNPPYSAESRNKSKWIQELLQPYKTEPEGGKLQERNSKLLNDDYVKFIRFAHDRISRTGHGVVAFITNHGWLNNVTFRGMRASLMRDFDEIYVIDLHGNSKKKEKTPEALGSQGDDKNVFDIEQGVAITFLIKKESAENFELLSDGTLPPRKAQIFYHELWGGRESKYNWLSDNDISTTPWQPLTPALPLLLLVPRNDDNLVEYNRFASVPNLMPLNTTGIKTHRDDVVFDFTAEALERKLKLLLDPKASLDAVRHQFFGENKSGSLAGDNETWSLERARNFVKIEDIKTLIKPSLYRPFDMRCLAYSEYLIDRPRKEVMAHFLGKSKNLGLALGRVGEATGSVEWDVAFVTDTMTEFNLYRRGGNNLFPLWLLQPKVAPKLNISPKLLALLAANLGVATLTDNHDLPEGVSAEDVIAYIYAVLHAPSYRTRYAEYLKSDFPRIPLGAIEGKASFAAAWKALVPLGQALIDLHLLRKVPAKLQANFPIQSSSEDSGIVVKPRYTEPKGLAKGRVWINTDQYFDGLPPETWNFKVGGYQVCEKWLKDRKGRKLTLDDVEHYNKVVAALTHTRELMAQIDAVANDALWPKSE